MKRMWILGLLVAGAVGLSSVSLALANGGLNMPFNRGAGKPAMMVNNTKILENKAAILGITADELKTQITAGKTLYALAQEKGLSFDELHKRAKDQVSTQLAALVKSGDITQKQMDSRLAAMDEQAAEAMVSGGGMMGGWGHGFGRKMDW